MLIGTNICTYRLLVSPSVIRQSAARVGGRQVAASNHVDRAGASVPDTTMCCEQWFITYYLSTRYLSVFPVRYYYHHHSTLRVKLQVQTRQGPVYLTEAYEGVWTRRSPGRLLVCSKSTQKNHSCCYCQPRQDNKP